MNAISSRYFLSFAVRSWYVVDIVMIACELGCLGVVCGLSVYQWVVCVSVGCLCISVWFVTIEDFIENQIFKVMKKSYVEGDRHGWRGMY